MKRNLVQRNTTTDPLSNRKPETNATGKTSKKALRATVFTGGSVDPLSAAAVLDDPLAGDEDLEDKLGVQQDKGQGEKRQNEERILEEWRRFRKQHYGHPGSLEKLNIEMVQQWNMNKREDAVQILMKVLRGISSESEENFSSRFFSTVDILLSFRSLLTTRLDGVQKEDYLLKELVQNWYQRISCTREFAPRFYLEVVLLSIHYFDEHYADPREVDRLLETLPGFGDIVSGLYATVFFSLMTAISCTDKEVPLRLYHQSNKALSCLKADEVARLTETITIPVLWILRMLVEDRPSNQILQFIQERKKLRHKSILLLGFLRALPSDMVKENTSVLVQAALEHEADHSILHALGEAMVKPGKIQNAKDVLKQVWPKLEQLQFPLFIDCVPPWLEFVSINFGIREITKIIQFLLNKKEDTYEEDLSKRIENILARIMKWISNQDLLEMPVFSSLASLISDDTVKLGVYTRILEAVRTENKMFTAVSTVQLLLNIAKYVGSSINALSPADQERQISELIISSIRCTNLQRCEKQLQYLTECRTAFSHLNHVQILLVREIHKLSSETQASRRSIQQALIAYAFITVPSIRSTQLKLNLHLVTAQLAFQKGCLAQGGACFRESFRLIEGLEPLDESCTWFRDYTTSLLSTLLAIPDEDESNKLEFFRLAVLAINNVRWTSISPIQVIILLEELKLMNLMKQDKLPYNFPGLSGNNVLYSGDSTFFTEIDLLYTRVHGLVLYQIQQIRETGQEGVMKKVQENAQHFGILLE